MPLHFNQGMKRLMRSARFAMPAPLIRAQLWYTD